MKGKTCVVTGATSGIGRETALGLAKLGARVLLTGRDRARAQAVAEDLRQKSGNPQVEFLTGDLSLRADVARLAGEIQAACPRLDVLVNNAGGIFMTREVTADGFEHTWALNHLAYFALTLRLLDLLKKSAPARIVSVASLAHRNGVMNFDDLQGEKSFSGMKLYAQSKLANIMFTYALARRLAGSGVTATCLHPGVIASGFGRNNKGFMKILVTALGPFLINEEKGARTSLWAASAPEAAGINGAYFVKCARADSTAASRDVAAQERLWRLSLQQTGLSDIAAPPVRAAGGKGG